jgi:hypothetical protein
MTGSSEMDGELPHCEKIINLEVRSSNFYLCYESYRNCDGLNWEGQIRA